VQSILVRGRIEKEKVMANSNGRMDQFTKENGKIIWRMVMEDLFTPMEIAM